VSPRESWFGEYLNEVGQLGRKDEHGVYWTGPKTVDCLQHAQPHCAGRRIHNCRGVCEIRSREFVALGVGNGGPFLTLGGRQP
jgi:hypothetical protein